jgi:hypothetical protein
MDDTAPLGGKNIHDGELWFGMKTGEEYRRKFGKVQVCE